jgi:hypothetical protein
MLAGLPLESLWVPTMSSVSGQLGNGPMVELGDDVRERPFRRFDQLGGPDDQEQAPGMEPGQ